MVIPPHYECKFLMNIYYKKKKILQILKILLFGAQDIKKKKRIEALINWASSSELALFLM